MKKIIFLFFVFCTFSLHADQDLISILYTDDDVFAVKDHYYGKDSSFSLKKGDLFFLSDETFHRMNDNQYYVTIHLTSCKSGKNHSFQSLLINTNPLSTIENISEKEKTIVETTYEVKIKHFDCYETKICPCWDVTVTYDVVVDGNQNYELSTRIREYTKENAEERKKNFPIVEENDQINWGAEQGGIKNCLFCPSKIFRESQEIIFTEVVLKGYKRNPIEKKVVTAPQEDLFCLIDHVFYLNPKSDLHIYASGKYTLASEEYEYLPGESYILTIGLFNPETAKSSYFKSMVTNHKDYAKIMNVERIQRAIVRERILFDQYKVTLEDKTTYRVEVEMDFPTYEKAQEASRSSTNYVLAGDEIFWGDGYWREHANYKNMNYWRGGLFRKGKNVPLYTYRVYGEVRNIGRLFRLNRDIGQK